MRCCRGIGRTVIRRIGIVGIPMRIGISLLVCWIGELHIRNQRCPTVGDSVLVIVAEKMTTKNAFGKEFVTDGNDEKDRPNVQAVLDRLKTLVESQKQSVAPPTPTPAVALTTAVVTAPVKPGSQTETVVQLPAEESLGDAARKACGKRVADATKTK